MRSHRTRGRAALLLLFLWALAETAHAGDPPKRIVFPVVGASWYEDDFGTPRGQGGHQANDIVAQRGAPVVAAEAGRITISDRSWRAGCMVYLYGRSGTTYLYVHLNNDLTRGNDNRGGCAEGVSYAPGLQDGQQVRAGQLLGYVGDSGDADGIHPHLHFELHPDDGVAVSPFQWLERARRLLFAAPEDGSAGLTLALYGSVRSAEGGALALRLERVRLSTGWRAEVARSVVLTVPADALVQRATGRGRQPASLESVFPGEDAVVWTTTVEPTLAAQLARPGVLAAAQVLLRG